MSANISPGELEYGSVEDAYRRRAVPGGSVGSATLERPMLGFERFLQRGLATAGGTRMTQRRGLKVQAGETFANKSHPFYGLTMDQATEKARGMYSGMKDGARQAWEKSAGMESLVSDRERGVIGGDAGTGSGGGMKIVQIRDLPDRGYTSATHEELKANQERGRAFHDRQSQSQSPTGEATRPTPAGTSTMRNPSLPLERPVIDPATIPPKGMVRAKATDEGAFSPISGSQDASGNPVMFRPRQGKIDGIDAKTAIEKSNLSATAAQEAEMPVVDVTDKPKAMLERSSALMDEAFSGEKEVVNTGDGYKSTLGIDWNKANEAGKLGVQAAGDSMSAKANAPGADLKTLAAEMNARHAESAKKAKTGQQHEDAINASIDKVTGQTDVKAVDSSNSLPDLKKSQAEIVKMRDAAQKSVSAMPEKTNSPAQDAMRKRALEERSRLAKLGVK